MNIEAAFDTTFTKKFLNFSMNFCIESISSAYSFPMAYNITIIGRSTLGDKKADTSAIGNFCRRSVSMANLILKSLGIFNFQEGLSDAESIIFVICSASTSGLSKSKLSIDSTI